MQFLNTKKLIVAGIALIGGMSVYYSTIMIHKNDNWAPKANLILNQAGTPKGCLLSLLAATNVVHDGTLNDIVAKTQTVWLRKPGQERWDLTGEKTINTKNLQSLFRDCGMIDEVNPALKEYDYVLVMGALASRMRLRLAHVLDLYDQGIRFKQIIFLGGMRPRQTQLENEETILGLGLKNDPLSKKTDWHFNGNLPETESEIMRVLYDQVDLPTDFTANVQAVFVDAPMKLNSEGQLVRPTTADTFAEWLKLNPTPGKCLVISNNPYIGYQDSVARTLLPSSFKIETVGTKDSGEKLSVHLDNLARWLHQEKQLRSL
jgi:hypothetical protein